MFSQRDVFLLHFPVTFDWIKPLYISSLHSHLHTRRRRRDLRVGGTNQWGAMRQFQGQHLALMQPAGNLCFQRNMSWSFWGDYFSQRFDLLLFVFVFISPHSLTPSLTIYESIKRVSHALRWSIILSRLFYTAASLWGSYTSCSWEEMAASLLFL